MDKKVKLIIAIIIIIICGTGVFIFESNVHSNKLSLENIQFSLPEGYSQIDNDKNVTAFSNGVNTYFIVPYKGKNVTPFINKYISLKSKENKSVDIQKFNVGNRVIYKSVVPEDITTFHYWFNYGNQIIEISTWNGDSNTDNVIIELIQSVT